MQDFLSGEAVNLTFRYGTGHEPVIPDVGTVLYTVFDHSGNPIAGLTNIPISTSTATFQSTITIPSLENAILPPRVFERRSIRVSYQKNGAQFNQRISYRLIPFVHYTVTPETVRNFLGVEPKELPDEDIDLFASYLYVIDSFAVSADFNDALISGGRMEIAANDAIAMRAAIDVIPSLQNRVAQSEKNGVMGFDRIKITNFSELLAAATDRYNSALALITETDLAAAEYTLITITQDTDPLTAGQG